MKASLAGRVLLIACATLVAQTAGAEDLTPWSVRAGPASVSFDVHADVSIAGTVVPGGSVSVGDNHVMAAEIGYALGSDWTARVILAELPTATVKVDGTLSGLVPPLTGTLGKVTYAPLVLTATYQFADWHGIRPYLGGGATYTMIYKTRDGDLANLDVGNASGPVLQAGVDIALHDRWSLFIDVRKLFIKTTATGKVTAFGGAPAIAEAKVAPLLMHFGVGYRF